MHGHDFAEIFWVEAGQGVHDARGAIALGRGYIALIGPGDEHAIRASWSSELILTNVAFEGEHLDAVLSGYGPASGYRALSALRSLTCSVSAECVHRLSARFARLAHSDLRALPLHAFLLDLLLCVEDDLEAGDRATRLPRWLSDTIDTACRQPDLLAEGVRGFAKRARRSVDHLNRTCHRYLSTTASGLVNRLRLDHAERLLRSTLLDVTEIAYRAGFGNLSYFYRLFRERYGSSPRAFREHSQQPVR